MIFNVKALVKILFGFLLWTVITEIRKVLPWELSTSL